MDKIYKKYQGHTIENGFSETSHDFKKFASYVKKRMKKLCKKAHENSCCRPRNCFRRFYSWTLLY